MTPNAQPHQDKELVKVMENVFVGGDGLGQMQNTYYLDCAKIEYWYGIRNEMAALYDLLLWKEDSSSGA